MRRLLIAGAIVGAIWLGVLPWLAEMPWVRARIERFESAGVNPGAIRYTDLPEIPGALERQRQRLADERRPFWVP